MAYIYIKYEADIVSVHSTYFATSLHSSQQVTYLDHPVRLVDRVEDGRVAGVILVRQSILLDGEGDVVDVGHLQSYLTSIQASYL